MTPAYTKKLGLWTQKTDIRAQKIDRSSLDTFEMLIVGFQVLDEQCRAWFFQKTFLFANTTMKMVLGMPFLTFSNADIRFVEKELTWRFYTIEKALPTTRPVELSNKKEFAKVTLDENVKAFVMHVSFLSLGLKMTIHPAREAQIASLLAEEVNVPVKYADFANVFSKKSAGILPKCTRINEHAIDLEDDKQPPYGPIYSLRLVELETLKTYIKINIANSFIRPLKSSASALI